MQLQSLLNGVADGPIGGPADDRGERGRSDPTREVQGNFNLPVVYRALVVKLLSPCAHHTDPVSKVIFMALRDQETTQ